MKLMALVLVAATLVPTGPAQGGPTINDIAAQWIDRDTVLWRVDPADRTFTLTGNGHTFALHPVGQTDEQRQRFPHLRDYTALRVDDADRATVTAAVRGQVVVCARPVHGGPVTETGVQLPGVLDDLYPTAAGATLGVTLHGHHATVAVWAPTAQDVSLELRGGPVVRMRRDDATGVWSATGAWLGRDYRYRVTAWQPATQRTVTASVTDPYSVDLSVDSAWSRVTDLGDRALAPPGWDRHRPAPVPAGRAQIQELSVRDFSIADRTVPADQRGTYLAFAGDGAGMRHLREQAAAGLTHVHLLPVFDFSTVPDRRADQARPDCDLASLPPDSDRQQACIGAVADRDGYNWGYDPLHYTTPEGSYARDPDHRIREFRAMVGGLHAAGLRVVLDVVYNHTSASGVDPHSVLDQIVPGYYHRLLDDGRVADSTCCSNTAPEHMMMGKLVVDSVRTWVRQYRVDGFRFDLMGHLPRSVMMDVRKAVGPDILLYGEGWNFGEVAGDARFTQATQANMAGTGIGTFNDRLRDAVRGGGPFDGNPRIQGFGTGLFTEPNGDPVNGTPDDQRARLLHYQDLIKVGLTGNLAGYRFTDSTGRPVTGAEVSYNGSPAGYTAAPGEAVTYVDAHDNEILYDALAFKLPPSTTPTDRARMQVLSLATTILGQGTGLIAAGSDRLRSKSLDRNSFNSGDWFNEILWDCRTGNGFGRGLPPAADNHDKWDFARPLLATPSLIPACDQVSATSAAYADLLRIRAASPAFGLTTAEEVQRRVSFPLSGPAETPGVLTMMIDGAQPTVVVFNATPDPTTQTVDAVKGRTVTLHPVQRNGSDPVVRRSSADSVTGTLTVPGRTVAVFVSEGGVAAVDHED